MWVWTGEGPREGRREGGRKVRLQLRPLLPLRGCISPKVKETTHRDRDVHARKDRVQTHAQSGCVHAASTGMWNICLFFSGSLFLYDADGRVHCPHLLISLFCADLWALHHCCVSVSLWPMASHVGFRKWRDHICILPISIVAQPARPAGRSFCRRVK